MISNLWESRAWRITLVLGLLVGGIGGGGLSPSLAQIPSPPPNAPSPLPGPSETDTVSSHFGRILLGSTVGAGVGTGVGLLLIKGAAEATPDDESDRRAENPASDAAATMGLIGVAAIVAGGPVGAVEIGGIERRRDAYVAGGIGEFVFGVAGLVLAGHLHDSTPARLIGLGTGVAVGAAGGAYWVASRPEPEGLFSYQDGRWQVGPPEVRVQPHFTTNRAPSVGVSLVSVQW